MQGAGGGGAASARAGEAHSEPSRGRKSKLEIAQEEAKKKDRHGLVQTTLSFNIANGWTINGSGNINVNVRVEVPAAAARADSDEEEDDDARARNTPAMATEAANVPAPMNAAAHAAAAANAGATGTEAGLDGGDDGTDAMGDPDSDDHGQSARAAESPSSDESLSSDEALATAVTGSPLRKKLRRYTKEERDKCVAIMMTQPSLASALRIINATVGFEKVSRANLQRWAHADAEQPEPRRKGRPVNVDFEKEVIGHLMFTMTSTVDGVEQFQVVANTAYSYDIIRHAAKDIKDKDEWKDIANVKDLTFSNCWVNSFLHRNSLRRLRVTTTAKPAQPTAVVQAHMEGVQAAITDGGYEPAELVNADETGFFYGMAPMNQYVPADAERGIAPAGNDKARFTVMMAGAADGTILPTFSIIKNSVEGADQSGSKVLDDKHLMAEPGFAPADGWEYRTWEKTLTWTVKGTMSTVTYKRNYIINRTSYHVITAHPTAWMDSIGMIMWIELVLGPWAARTGGRKLLTMDNCGPHSVPAVRDAFAANNIELHLLPPNLTSELQVMDLVVNGPLKAAIRRERCRALHNDFLLWKGKWAMELLKPAAERRLQPFSPPKPTLSAGLSTLFKTVANEFTAPKFREGMRRCFVSVGLTKDPSVDPPAFVRYTPKKAGFLAARLGLTNGPREDQFNIAELVAETPTEARPDMPAEVEGVPDEAIETVQTLPIPPAAAAAAANAGAAATGPEIGVAEVVLHLKDEWKAERLWFDYLGARTNGQVSVAARRLAAFQELAESIIKQWGALSRTDRAAVWEGILAEATAAAASADPHAFEPVFW
jgi:hypothetical protein